MTINGKTAELFLLIGLKMVEQCNYRVAYNMQSMTENSSNRPHPSPRMVAGVYIRFQLNLAYTQKYGLAIADVYTCFLNS